MAGCGLHRGLTVLPSGWLFDHLTSIQLPKTRKFFMQNSKILKTILFVSGAIGMIVGFASLVIPVAFHASAGITLGDSINLLSEMRAAGGALFAGSALVLLGVFLPQLTFTASVVASLLYGSYGLSRLLAIALDGMPSAEILQITGFELVFALLNLFALLKYKKPQASCLSSQVS
jgi:hypothetical protein